MKGFTGKIDLSLNDGFLCTYGAYNEKFCDDKVNYEDADYRIMIDGVLLNRTALMGEYCAGSTAELVMALWQRHGRAMLTEMKGSFVLMIYEKKENKLFVANDRLSKRPIYYHIGDGNKALYFSSRFCDLVYCLREDGVSLSTDRLSTAMMLGQGMIYGDRTWYNEIKYLSKYCCLEAGGGGLLIRVSALLPLENHHTPTPEQAVERFNELFDAAVRLQYTKNEECGYRQIATLSAGMDSRSTVLQAVKSGFKEMTCFTYAQTGSLDHTVSQAIALDQGFDFLFYPLDNASFLFDSKYAVERNEGFQYYAGATGAIRVSRLLDAADYGIIHTGSLGGELMSDVLIQSNDCEAVNPFREHRSTLIGKEEIAAYDRLIKTHVTHGNLELDKNLRVCQNFFRMFEPKLECFSPFLDEDVFAYVSSLPPQMKYRRALYKKWMMRFLPNRYPTTYFAGKVTTGRIGRKFKSLQIRLARMFFGKSKQDMNPFEFWFNDSRINNRLNAEFEQLFTQSTLPSEILTEVKRIWQENGRNKCFALTCLRLTENEVK